MKAAVFVPNLTLVAPVNDVPVMITGPVTPDVPCVGVKPVIFALIFRTGPTPVPPEVVTETVPVVARLGTVTWTCVSDRTFSPVPSTVPPPAFVNDAAVAPVRFEPLIVIFLPTGAAATL